MTFEKAGNRLVLSGAIDETANLLALLDHAVEGRLVLDLAGITFINSIGSREWMRMQRAAGLAKIWIELHRVAEPLVHQLNINPAARGVSVVTSFFAPYECDDCDREHLMLIDVRMYAEDLVKMKAPALECPDCKRPLSFSDPGELYFT